MLPAGMESTADWIVMKFPGPAGCAGLTVKTTVDGEPDVAEATHSDADTPAAMRRHQRFINRISVINGWNGSLGSGAGTTRSSRYELLIYR